jgi:hypothetical protein
MEEPYPMLRNRHHCMVGVCLGRYAPADFVLPKVSAADIDIREFAPNAMAPTMLSRFKLLWIQCKTARASPCRAAPESAAPLSACGGRATSRWRGRRGRLRRARKKPGKPAVRDRVLQALQFPQSDRTAGQRFRIGSIIFCWRTRILELGGRQGLLDRRRSELPAALTRDVCYRRGVVAS